MPKCVECNHPKCIWVGAETRVGLCNIFVPKNETKNEKPKNNADYCPMCDSFNCICTGC